MKAKRTIAGALSLAMLASTALSMQVSAADTVTLKAAKVEAEAGGAFSVDVSLADIPASKINVLDFALTYDNTILTVDKVTVGPSADPTNLADETAAEAPIFSSNIKDTEIDISWTTALASDAWIAEDGVIFTISGTVKEGVADGTVTPIDFAPVSRDTHEGSGVANASLLVGYIYGTDYAEYTVTAEAGSVTIGKGAITTDTTTTTTGESTTTAASETETTASGASETTKESGATTTMVTANANVLYGDVNCDGKVEISDAVLLNKKAAGAVDLNEQASLNADCDANNEINSSDALVLLKFLVSLIKTLPSAG